ncbi:hypothetical protein PanWU01x14_352430 [Parasponia andersonii]|uniref:DUF1985 domain-containing protein n=1 Tax=Parasponia andersonii TaxID=3476 RepID=A0A2P5AAA4_PARAD|nr:hypothetical protein PanWU01x14_352430 [Parasponia andersonii]
MSKLIVPFEQHYIRRVTFRGSPVILKIKECFEALDLMEMVEKCLFKQHYEAPPLQFSKVLIHHLLLKKVESLDNMKEIYFDIGGKHIRFGLCEFALTTGLNFGKYRDIPKL